MTRAHALLVALTACHTPWVEEPVEGLRHLSVTARPGANGRIPLDVEVRDDEVSLLLTVVPPPDLTGFVYAADGPGGAVFLASDHWDSDRTLTNAGFASSVVNLNWPIRAVDVPLEPGWWTFDARVDTQDPVEVALSLKTDDAPDTGALGVDVVFAGDVGADDELVRGTMAAVQHWRDAVYAPAGLELTVSYTTWEGPSSLDSPGKGSSDAYLELSSASSLRTVTVVVVDRLLDGAGVLGVSGGIPGALVPTSRSVIAVSALLSAGSDRVFTRAEERVFGETLAHEVGHYLGLFHPVELPKEGEVQPSVWDSLDDTEDCRALEACGVQLGDNLMFPTPICDETTLIGCVTYRAQTLLTAGQQGVLHRNTAVD